MIPVTLHWRTGPCAGTLTRVSAQQVTIVIEGDDAPFQFDKTPDGWVEHDWGGHAPIRITDMRTGESVGVQAC